MNQEGKKMTLMETETLFSLDFHLTMTSFIRRADVSGTDEGAAAESEGIWD